MSNQPYVLYRFFGADETLLYIGITSDPGQRVQQHAATKNWWGEVLTILMEHHPDRESLLLAERDAIIAEGPRYNIVHNGGMRASRESIPAQGRVFDGLVGRFFSNGYVFGQVVGRESQFLVAQIHLGGMKLGDQILVAPADMTNWTFYSTPHELNMALGCGEFLDDGKCERIPSHKTYDGYRCLRCAAFYPDAVFA